MTLGDPVSLAKHTTIDCVCEVAGYSCLPGVDASVKAAKCWELTHQQRQLNPLAAISIHTF